MPARTVRIYVSSIYRDMRVERKVLHRVVLPELRRRCAGIGVEVIKVDPCWRVSEAAAEGDGALARRFAMIEECKPYFIGLFGSQAGRHVDRIPKDMLKSYPWLARHVGESINELEVRRAVRGKDKSSRRAFFYFRMPSLDPEDPRRPSSRVLKLVAAIESAGLRVQRYPWHLEDEQVTGLDDFAWRVIEDVWNAIRGDFGSASAASRTTVVASTPASRIEEPPPRVDENVQFTTYAPQAVAPGKWYSLLAFAHLAELADPAPCEPGPIDEVRRQAAEILGPQRSEYRERQQDSGAAIPGDSEITFLPNVPGVEFAPARRTFQWRGKTHREEFELRAAPDLDGRTARGVLTVFLGPILIAEINLAIKVRSADTTPRDLPIDRTSARTYRKIFASYSHKDRTIVERFERYASSIGDTYLRDWVHLRSGEVWSDQLEQLIAEADVFQLFWSSNSMFSPFVELEWRYALSLNRPNFVRPTYWESPLPQSRDPQRPPQELNRFHFKYIGLQEVLDTSPKSPSAGKMDGPQQSDTVTESITAHVDEAEIEAARRRAEEGAATASGVEFKPSLTGSDMNLPVDLTTPAPHDSQGDDVVEAIGFDPDETTMLRRSDLTEDERILAEELERQRLEDASPAASEADLYLDASPSEDFETREQPTSRKPASPGSADTGKPQRPPSDDELSAHPSLGGFDVELPPRSSVTRRPPSEDSFEMTAHVGPEDGSDTEIDVSMSDAEAAGERRPPNPTEEQIIIAAELERRRHEAEQPSTRREAPMPLPPPLPAPPPPARSAPPPPARSAPAARAPAPRAARPPAAAETRSSASWKPSAAPRTRSRLLFGIAAGLLLGAGVVAVLWFADLLPKSSSTTSPKERDDRARRVDPAALASARLLLDSDDPGRAIEAFEKLDRESPAVLASLGQARWLKYVRDTGKNQPDAGAPAVVQARKELAAALARWQASPDPDLEVDAVRAVLWQGRIEVALGNVEKARDLYVQSAGQFSETNRQILLDAAERLKDGG